MSSFSYVSSMCLVGGYSHILHAQFDDLCMNIISEAIFFVIIVNKIQHACHFSVHKK